MSCDESQSRLSDEYLLRWVESEESFPGRIGLYVLGIIQPLILIITAIWTFLLEGPREPLYLALVFHVLTLLLTRRRTSTTASILSGPEQILTRYARCISVLEKLPEDVPGKIKGS